MREHRYDAFMSYSHAADGRLAPAIQRGLHRLARQWHRPRALNVFRDTTGLAANPGLWSSIREAIDKSRFFILLASPEAARSEWVEREIQHCRNTKPPTAILTVLTDGEWHWDSEHNDFDWEASTAVPPALAGAFSEEPRHIDLRWAREETDLSLRHSRFRDRVAELAAPIHGVSKEDLEGEDVRQHRRRRSLIQAVSAFLLLLLAAVAVAGLFAVRNANLARANEEEAQRQAAVAKEEASRADAEAERALARAVSSQAELLTNQPDLALLLHLGALEINEESFTHRSLLRSLIRLDSLQSYWRPPRQQGPTLTTFDAFHVDGHQAVWIDGASGFIEIWDVGNRKQITSRVLSVKPASEDLKISETLPANAIAIPITGLVGTYSDRVTMTTFLGQVIQWDPADDSLQVIDKDCLSLQLPRPLALMKERQLLAYACAEPGNPPRERLLLRHLTNTERVLAIPVLGQVESLDLSPDGEILAAAVGEDALSGTTRIQFFDVLAGTSIRSSDVSTGGRARIRFNPKGDRLAVGGLDGRVQLIDVTSLEIGAAISGHSAPVSTLSFDPSGELLVTGDQAGGITTWTTQDTGAEEEAELRVDAQIVGHDEKVQAIHVESDGSHVTSTRDSVAWWTRGSITGGRQIYEDRTTFGLAGLNDGSVVYPTPDGLTKYDPDTDEQEHWLTGKYNYKVVASADGSRLAAGIDSVDVVDTATREKIFSAEANSPGAPLMSAALSPSGQYLALSFSNEECQLYRVDTAELVFRFCDNVPHSNALAFSPDGRLFVVSHSRKTQLVDLHSYEILQEIQIGATTEALAFSQDGEYLAVGTGLEAGSVVVFRVDSDSLEIREVLTFTDPAVGVKSLAFDPGGDLLLAGTWDARVFAIDVKSGERVGWSGTAQNLEVISAIAFTAPDIAFIAGSGGVTVLDWRIASLRAAACAITGRELTEAEWLQFFGGSEYRSVCE